MSDEHDANFSLVVAFDSDHPEFTRGFEAGCAYEQLRAPKGPRFELQGHSSNAEMMLRMAEALGWKLQAMATADPSWLLYVFTSGD